MIFHCNEHPIMHHLRISILKVNNFRLTSKRSGFNFEINSVTTISYWIPIQKTIDGKMKMWNESFPQNSSNRSAKLLCSFRKS